jgi:hypothetical protein
MHDETQLLLMTNAMSNWVEERGEEHFCDTVVVQAKYIYN